MNNNIHLLTQNILTVKVLLLGSRSVGKTTLFSSLRNCSEPTLRRLDQSHSDLANEVSDPLLPHSFSYTTHVENTPIQMTVIDIDGSLPDHSSLLTTAIVEADAFVLVYNEVDESTLSGLNECFQLIRIIKPSKDLSSTPFLLIANSLKQSTFPKSMKRLSTPAFTPIRQSVMQSGTSRRQTILPESFQEPQINSGFLPHILRSSSLGPVPKALGAEFARSHGAGFFIINLKEANPYQIKRILWEIPFKLKSMQKMKETGKRKTKRSFRKSIIRSLFSNI